MEYWPRFSPQELQNFALIKYGGKGNSYHREAWALDTSSLISPHFYGGGRFLRRLISTEKANFLRKRFIFKEKAALYGESSFLQRRAIVISVQQVYTCMENNNNFTKEASFYLGRRLFYIVQQWY